MKKFLSHGLLALMLLVGFGFGATFFGAETVNAEANAAINDTVSYGGNTWIVVSDITLGSGDDKAYLVVSRDAVSQQRITNDDNPASADWNSNSNEARAYLNGEFLSQLDDVDKVALKVKITKDSTSPIEIPQSYDSEFFYRSTVAPDASGDTAFLLSLEEIQYYYEKARDEKVLFDQVTWLRTQQAGDGEGASYGWACNAQLYSSGHIRGILSYYIEDIHAALYLKEKYLVENPTGETNWIIQTDEPEPTPDPTPTPTPTPTPAPVVDNSSFLLAQMTSNGSKALNISWTKVNGAAGYDIFLSKCNKGKNVYKPQKVKTITGASNTKWTKKGLKKKTAYKGYVKAYVMKDGQKTYVATSPIIHAFTTNGNKYYTNAKSVTVKKSKVSLKAGKTFKIKASVKKAKSGKKLISKGHAEKLRYISNNVKVAKVNDSGNITAVAKGTCKVYAYTVNGVKKAVKVTVK